MASASRAPGLAHTRGLGGGREARGIPRLNPALERGVQLRQAMLRPVCDRVGQRPYDLLSGQRQARRGAAHRAQPAARRRGSVPVPLDGRSGARAGGDRGRLRATLSPGARPRRAALRRLPGGDAGVGARAHMTTRGAARVRERLQRSLERWQEPGAAELCETLGDFVGGAARPGERLHLERLKSAVYRLKVGSALGHDLILKRHPPAVAQTDRLVVERWLPALDLGDGCPHLLAAVAEREGCWVWHVYEDLGDGNLAAERLPWRLDAAVDFMAELHLRAPRHPLVPEARGRARDHGGHFFTSNGRDAVAALEALATPPRDVPLAFAGARERPLPCLFPLRDDAPRSVRVTPTASSGRRWPCCTTAPSGASASSWISSPGSGRYERPLPNDRPREAARRHRRRFRHQPRRQPRDRRGASRGRRHEHQPDGEPARERGGGRAGPRMPGPERRLASRARSRRCGGRAHRAPPSGRPLHRARRRAADACGLAPRRAQEPARPALRACVGRAHRGTGARVLQRAPPLEVLRSVGRRDPSGANQPRWTAPPAGCRARPGRDRADLQAEQSNEADLLQMHSRARSRATHAVRAALAPRARGARHSPGGVSGPAGGRGDSLPPGGRSVIAVISVYKVANFPDGGGHFWVYMQYAQGLRRLGCEVYWLEQFRPPPDPAQEATLLSRFFERMRRFGLEGKALLYSANRGRAEGPESFRFVCCESSEVEGVLRRADLLLNFHYAIHPGLLARARRTALIDIDPGLLQFWMSTGQLAVPAHDCYMTTGETVGTPAARFSDCGLRWQRIRPPVCLELWPFTYDPQAEAFTTVSSWSTTDWLKGTENGKTVLRENTKRVAFLPDAELPRHTSQPLELALYTDDRDAQDLARLVQNGWRVRHSAQVAASPQAYRSYIQRSRGEFSCAKTAYIEFLNPWVSDRTVCYLASGKPVVVQDTGPSSYLPNGEGMFRFTTQEQAARAFDAINADYERHCRAARRLAETHFDARLVLTKILNETLS